MYHGKFDPKREVCTLKGTMTLSDYKVCLYIHICIYRHLYRSLLSQSSGIQAQFHWIPVPFHWNPVDSCGIRWNPAEWMHSCRNLWGIKKYSIQIFNTCTNSWYCLEDITTSWRMLNNNVINSSLTSPPPVISMFSHASTESITA